MAGDYFQEHEAFIVAQPLPSPSDTPYHTPMPSLSRRSSRYGTPSSGPPSSPPPLPPDGRDSEDTANDENISILDPRRFTPTLHASLVSEILSLRRELDSKHKFIEDLETNLQTARNESDSLTDKLARSTKESRAAERQLQQLENETMSALDELAKERDEVREANVDLRNRLESSQKKIRSQEDDSNRVHNMWERDKETWDGEKRMLERRVHISESRLKMILDELAAQDAAQDEQGMDSEGDDNTRDSGVGHESDTASIRSSPQRRSTSRTGMHSRNLSSSSHRSLGRNYRFSLMSGAGSDGHGRLNGPSLADELIFDEEEEDLGELELDSDDFPENEMRARRALESRQSMYQDEKAKRVLGLTIESKGPLAEVAEGDPSKPVETSKSCEVATVRELTLINILPKRQYVDTGVQFSPPPSPFLPQDPVSVRYNEQAQSLTDIEANQRRKRVSVIPHSQNVQQTPIGVKLPAAMISASSQTLEQPPSPPATPKITIPPSPQTPITPLFKIETASISTQTDPLEEPRPIAPPPRSPNRAPPPVPIPIPSIAIHPPRSAPASPKEPILPPGTKNAWSQTTVDLRIPTRSISIQTGEIRIDRRPVKLPPHLLPSAISSKPGTPEPRQGRPEPGKRRMEIDTPATSVSSGGGNRQGKAPTLRHTQDLTTLLGGASGSKTEDRYPGNNDNGPLVRSKDDGIRRPFRSSSLFAGFDGASSDEDEDIEADFSDDDYRAPQYSTPMMSSRNLKRPFNNPPTPVPEDKEVVSTSRTSEDSTVPGKMYSSGRNSFEKASKVAKPLRSAGLTRQPSIRRSAMIQNGTVAHFQRSRSPSIGSVGSSNNYVPKPPFPVPTRSSSRRIPLSKSEGSQSPTPRGGGAFSGRRLQGGRQHQRKDSLRKVRSAAVMPRSGRQRSRSPPLPATPVLPQSPQIPPLPNDMITGAQYGYRNSHRSQLSTNTSNTGNGSVGSSVQSTSVVDAIAATMVGEWMWKYVRKRKTFGGPESPQDLGRAGDDGSVMPGNGIRHKRWVWLSPYERAVMWSSKQPTSGSALMGKSGRKCEYYQKEGLSISDANVFAVVIKSVLDVPDNTPLPKSVGIQTIFNRSILILTPARALKFTAISRERHYLWLTALSFLAHSTQGIPELGALPPVPPQEELPPRHPGATLRRAQIRDSVRLAKDKALPVNQRQNAPRADPIHEWYGESQFDRPIADAADAPSIPRIGHGRKRSSTGPRVPPPSAAFRSFSHNQVPSMYSAGSSDIYGQPPSVPSSVYNPASVITSARTSEASSPARYNFFDAVGTVRMEAFVEPTLSEDAAYGSMLLGAKPRPGRRRGNSQWSGSTNDPHRGGGVYEDFVHDNFDPFRGF
jgi:Meiotic cell cortex C-terminal pleckstrin homology